MALTREFRETTMRRAHEDPAFRRGLLAEGVRLLLTGDPEDAAVGRSFLRDYVNATLGFQKLAEATGRAPESLMRMLGPHGNPSLANLSRIIGRLQREEGVDLFARDQV